MTGPGERHSRLGSGRGTGRVLMSVSVALAVAAAVVLALGFDDARLLRLGVVAALWAALAGSFAVARTRSEAGSAADRADQLHEVYQLELEREVAARREHELTVERELRRDLERGSRDELDALRAELHTLRRTLESVLGGELLVERVALRTTEATRVRSLTDQDAAAPHQPSQRAAQQPPQQARGNGTYPTPEVSGLPRRHPAARAAAPRRPHPETPPQQARPHFADDPLFGDVPWRPEVRDGHGAAGGVAGPTGPAPNGNGTSNGWARHPAGNGRPRPATEDADGAHTGGRSVEDLLAAYGSDSAPRRRRRRDDG